MIQWNSKQGCCSGPVYNMPATVTALTATCGLMGIADCLPEGGACWWRLLQIVEWLPEDHQSPHSLRAKQMIWEWCGKGQLGAPLPKHPSHGTPLPNECLPPLRPCASTLPRSTIAEVFPRK